ncbi:MAG: GerMN domain-containing protein [Armatimonadota bacterium]|nr:GerMN domain-containing protein [Armatimonadota bacterium]
MMRRVMIWLLVLAAASAVVWWTQVRPVPTRVDVYFVGTADNAGTLVAVERVVEGRRPEVLVRAAIEVLLAGPTADERARGLTTEIPAGVRLRGLSVRDGVATLDLSEAIASGGGSSSMQGRLWQLVYTGTQFGVRQVRILIEGEERPALGGEGVLIDRPIGRPPAFPRF